MRRTIAAAVVAVATAFTLLPAQAATADGEVVQPAETASPATDDQADQAEQALTTVRDLLVGKGTTAERRSGGTEQAGSPDLTLAMRDLYVALPRLDADQREEAEALMARPTDGANDRLGDGYSVPARRSCGGNFCVHYVTSTADAAPSSSWVRYTLGTMNKVWKHEVRRLGYRKPLSDRAAGSSRNGGNGKFDIYLKDLGSRGLYGYCVPEFRLVGAKYRWRATAYCVLDNDFARAQFGTAPKPTLQVTAAHEFFHAVQFSYDYGEDRWFMESTATWMEERYADRVNDNRQYLRSSQIRAPHVPLDTFTGRGSFQYANWAFWEYLSERYGNRIVRDVWVSTAPRGKRNTYALGALKKQLRRHGGFARVFAAYSAGNAFPSRTYSEGRRWPSPALAGSAVLSRKSPARAGTLTLNHLSSGHLRLRPDKGLRSKRWKLKVKVDGPSRKASPAAVVTVQLRNGRLVRKTVRLNRNGKGQTKVSFSRRTVRSVTVTAVNASTRFSCYRASPSADPQFSCQGVPRDDRKPFAIKVAAVPR